MGFLMPINQVTFTKNERQYAIIAHSCRETLFDEISYWWTAKSMLPDEIVFSCDANEIASYGLGWSYGFNKNFLQLISQYSIREKLCTNIKNDINLCFPNLLLKNVTYSNSKYNATFACDEKFAECAYYSSAILAIINAATKFNIFASSDATQSLYLYTNPYGGDYIKILQDWAQSEKCNFERYFTKTDDGAKGLKYFITQNRISNLSHYKSGYSQTFNAINDYVIIDFPIDEEASLLLTEKIVKFSQHFNDTFDIKKCVGCIQLIKKPNVTTEMLLADTFYLYSLALYNNIDILCSDAFRERYNRIGLYKGDV